MKLADSGALRLGELLLLVVDTGRDVKGMSLLEMQGLSSDFFAVFRRHLGARAGSGALRLCLW